MGVGSMKKYLIERGTDKTIMTEQNLLWFTQSQTKLEACNKLDRFDDLYKVTPITWLSKKERLQLIKEGILEPFDSCL